MDCPGGGELLGVAGGGGAGTRPARVLGSEICAEIGIRGRSARCTRLSVLLMLLLLLLLLCIEMVVSGGGVRRRVRRMVCREKGLLRV